MRSKPLVTVYIATCNRLPLLKHAVQSVLAQDYAPIELIVVDDGSSDGTAAWLEAFAAEGKLRYFSNEVSRGACHARNRALFAAHGEFITGLDDDDEFTPGRISHLIDAYRDEYACVASSMLERRDDGAIPRQNDLGPILLAKLLHANCIGNQVLTRTSRLQAIGGFDEALSAFQDFDAWVRLVARYGPAYKTRELAYLWNTAGNVARISDNDARKRVALEMFRNKHRVLMRREHLQSMALLEMKLQEGRVSPRRLLQSVNCNNWKSALAILLIKNYPGLKGRLDALRANRA